MDLGMLHAPVYTGLFTAVLMIMQMVLMGLVIRNRGAKDILIGTGGNDVMEQSMRAHGNFIENAPTFLIGLALIELMVGDSMWVLVLGCVFVLCRILHAVGLSMTSGLSIPRFVGTLGSIIATIVAGGYLGYIVIGKM